MDHTEFELFSEVDEDGFVALVCPETYAGYVAENWTLEQVVERFLEQINSHTLFVAHPGPNSADEPLRISDRPSPVTALREASGFLQVGEDGLWLTDYTQLTMSAQFADEAPIAGHHTRLPVAPGAYRVTIRQLASSPAVELVIQRAETAAHQPRLNTVPWLE